MNVPLFAWFGFAAFLLLLVVFDLFVLHRGRLGVNRLDGVGPGVHRGHRLDGWL